jgi:hypothetical protein
MFCPKCGQQNDDNAYKCVKCGEILQQAAPTGALPPGTVPNYLVQAILVTIFCCLPFGIAAIVFAAQVNGKLAAGDMAGAVAASNKAKLWSWISFGTWFILVAIYVVLIIIGAVISSQQHAAGG